jgi:GNAT superfamily N-acetyltransferase
MSENMIIRNLKKEDCQIISDAFREQNWDKPLEQYLKYFNEQKTGIREVFVAEYKNEFAGYVTIIWQSHYPPFGEEGIPEIVDFNVIKKFQRKGIGTKLMGVAEDSIAKKSDVAGIGVGLYSDYGNAQRLYVKRGYIPDGRGIFQDREFLRYGDNATVDDSLALYFTKNLK